jgi:hypothetical protein
LAYICDNERWEIVNKRKYKPNKEKLQALKEPAALYGNRNEKSIIISSLNEQDESNYRYWLSLSPEERWAEHYKLLQRVYGVGKKNKPTVLRIIFDA